MGQVEGQAGQFCITALGNGLQVVVSPLPHTRSVTAAVLVGAGSRYEAPEQAGAFHFIEHLCFKGSRRYPSARLLAEAVEGVGGVVNGATDREMTYFWCKVPHAHLQRALDVLLDMVRHPLFDPQKVERERQVVLEELALANDYPDQRVGLLVDSLLWPDQPLGRDVGGTPETVSALGLGQLLECFEAQYTPPNMVVAVAGRVEPGEVVEEVARRVEDWGGRQPRPWFPARNGARGPRVRLEHRRTDQAHLALGMPGLPSTHPDRYALDLLNTILGEGMSSRLFQEVRERLGLAYDVHSTVSHLQDCGSLVVYAGVDPAKVEPAVQAILRELEQLARGVPPEELAKAREMVRGRLLLRLEDSRAVAFWGGVQQLLHRRVHTVEEELARLDGVTPEDIARVARGITSPRALRLALVGPYRSEARLHRLLE